MQQLCHSHQMWLSSFSSKAEALTLPVLQSFENKFHVQDTRPGLLNLWIVLLESIVNDFQGSARSTYRIRTKQVINYQWLDRAQCFSKALMNSKFDEFKSFYNRLQFDPWWQEDPQEQCTSKVSNFKSHESKELTHERQWAHQSFGSSSANFI